MSINLCFKIFLLLVEINLRVFKRRIFQIIGKVSVKWHLNHQPVDCFIAIEDKKGIVGFACVDTTFKGFFGSLGVKDSMRGRGIGRALTLMGLQELRYKGYQYAIVGGTRIPDFYRDVCGAIVIQGSCPSVYKGML